MARIALIILGLAIFTHCQLVTVDCQSNDLTCNPLAAHLFFARESGTVSYVASGAGCKMFYSYNGEDWISGSNLPGCVDGGIFKVVNAANRFVGAGALTSTLTGCGIWTSDDGIHWSQKSCGAVTQAQTALASGSAFGLTEIITGGEQDGANNYTSLLSTDLGETWSNLSFGSEGGPGAGDRVTDIAYLPDVQIFLLYQPVPQGTRIRVLNGLWNATRQTAIGLLLADLAVGPFSGSYNRVLAVSQGTTSAQYTDDIGFSFNTTLPNVFSGAGLAPRAVTRGADRFAVVRDTCGYTFLLDGTADSSGLGTPVMDICSGDSLSAIVYGDRYVVGSDNGNFYTSSSGELSGWKLSSFSAPGTEIQAIGYRRFAF